MDQLIFMLCFMFDGVRGAGRVASEPKPTFPYRKKLNKKVTN